MVVNMSRISGSVYQQDLEGAVLDLVRVGSTGFASGVAQIASRMIRSVPVDVADPDAFREKLHASLKKAGSTKGLRFAGGQVPTDEATSSRLVEIEPFPEASHLAANPSEKCVLDDLVLERRESDKLTRAGVPLTRTVMFTGAPGVGKSLAARWLAEKLELPLVTMSLAATLSSHLGTSGKNVKAVLDYAQSAPCVLFIDEFDAIAKNRDDDTDIGELKRIVNVVLMELDRWPTSTLLLVATNHEHLLDPAIRRRFDTLLRFSSPSESVRKQLFLNLAGHGRLEAPFVDALAKATPDLTGSDIERIWNTSSRRAVLRDFPIEHALGEEIIRIMTDDGRPEVAFRLLSEQLGWSNRKIATVVGVTHPTVASALRRIE